MGDCHGVSPAARAGAPYSTAMERAGIWSEGSKVTQGNSRQTVAVFRQCLAVRRSRSARG
jgi:hypothetical protein